MKDLARTCDVADLTALGVPAECCRPSSLSLDSERFVTALVGGSSPEVIVVDLSKKNTVTRKCMRGEACLMHPKECIISVYGSTPTGPFIQVFNMDTRAKVSSWMVPSGETLSYWTWLTPECIGIVTTLAVYHWDISTTNTETVPEKIFVRTAKIPTTAQVVSYAQSSDKQWCALSGIFMGTDSIQGITQLYSVEKGMQQIISGHVASFGRLYNKIDSWSTIEIVMFAEKKEDLGQTKLHVMDVSSPRSVDNLRANVDLSITASEFPVGILLNSGLIHCLTSAGTLFIIEAYSCTILSKSSLTTSPVFRVVPAIPNKTRFVDQEGKVMDATIDLEGLTNSITDEAMLLRLTAYGFKGNSNQGTTAVLKELEKRLSIKQDTAVLYAASAPIGSAWRSQEALDLIKNAPSGGKSALIDYFKQALQQGKLNAAESIEIVKPVVVQNRPEYLEHWLKEDRLQFSETLAELIKPVLPDVSAMMLSQCTEGSTKITNLSKQGDFSGVLEAILAEGSQLATFSSSAMSEVLKCMHQAGAEQTADVGSLLVESGVLSVSSILQIFASPGLSAESLESILGIKISSATSAEQTRYVSLLVSQAPEVAERIILEGKVTDMDRQAVLSHCERNELFSAALFLCSEQDQGILSDITKRILLRASGTLKSDQFSKSFKQCVKSNHIPVLREILSGEPRAGPAVAAACALCHPAHGGDISEEDAKRFLDAHAGPKAVKDYLLAVVPIMESSSSFIEYIKILIDEGQITEITEALSSTEIYDPAAVRDLLMDTRLSDPRPLIALSGRHGFGYELAGYLIKTGQERCIVPYVRNVPASEAAKVLAGILDKDPENSLIRSSLAEIRDINGAESLITTFESRNSMKLLLPWLESRLEEGCTDSSIHNAQAKLLIDSMDDFNSVRNFLITNKYIDCRIIGNAAAVQYPELALILYLKAECDLECLEMTKKSCLWKLQCEYLLSRNDLELWAAALSEHQTELETQFSESLWEKATPKELQTALEAFKRIGSYNIIYTVAESIVLRAQNQTNPIDKLPFDCSLLATIDEKKLISKLDVKSWDVVNLLIQVAGDHYPEKLAEVVKKVEVFDKHAVADKALNGGNYEVAFNLYDQQKLHALAAEALLRSVSIETNNDENKIMIERRVKQYGLSTKDPGVWSKLGAYFLEQNRPTEAMEAFVSGKDPRKYKDVLEAIKGTKPAEKFITYATMCRDMGVRESVLDTRLVKDLALLGKKTILTTLLDGQHRANLDEVAEEFMRLEDITNAIILFNASRNHIKLANCYTLVGDYSSALVSCRRVNNIVSWSTLLKALIEAQESTMIQTVAMEMLAVSSMQASVVDILNNSGMINDLIAVLERALSSNLRISIATLTELGVLYIKHDSIKLIPYLKDYGSAANDVVLVEEASKRKLWKEVVSIYLTFSKYNKAINTILEYPDETFESEKFTNILSKLTDTHVAQKALIFYAQYLPDEALTSALNSVESIMPIEDSVKFLVENKVIRRGFAWLKKKQSTNNCSINETINALYLDDEDHEALHYSITTYDNYNKEKLCSQLEKSNNKELRALATTIYGFMKNYKKAVELLISDKNLSQATITVVESRDPIVANRLLEYYLDNKLDEDFVECVSACSGFLDVAELLELCWSRDCTTLVMPTFIQLVREITRKVNSQEAQIASIMSRLDAIDGKNIHVLEEKQQEVLIDDVVKSLRKTSAQKALPGII